MRTRLERLLAIEKEIRADRFPSVEDLCRTYTVKPRTVYNDIRILRERVGLDIQFDRLRNGYFNASPSSKLPTFDLSTDEYLLLVLACEMLSSSTGETIRPILNQILEKIRDRVPAVSVIATYIERETFSSDGGDNQVGPGVLLQIAHACLEKAPLEIKFKSTSMETESIELEFGRLVESNKFWFLSGNQRQSGATRRIPLNDILEIRILEQMLDSA